GRLPITFYKSDSDLPDFNDYSMDNRTYRYFKGQPLYGFGYGLSYTNFRYDQLKIPSTVRAGKNVSVTVRVTNTGKMEGEEVVELYVANPDKAMKGAVRALKGFKRIALKAGENKIVQFELTPQSLFVTDDKGTYKPYQGSLLITVGGSQPDE